MMEICRKKALARNMAAMAQLFPRCAPPAAQSLRPVSCACTRLMPNASSTACAAGAQGTSPQPAAGTTPDMGLACRLYTFTPATISLPHAMDRALAKLRGEQETFIVKPDASSQVRMHYMGHMMA